MMYERRGKQRNLCSDIVELFWNDSTGWPHRAKAVLEDISLNGACVQLETKIPVNSDVALRLRDTGFPGQVRYCTLIGGSYFVGVEFAENSGWMPGLSDPRHLLVIPPLTGFQPAFGME